MITVLLILSAWYLYTSFQAGEIYIDLPNDWMGSSEFAAMMAVIL